MKYCIKYYRNIRFDYLDEVEELEIRYNKKDTTLLDFLDKYKDKTIIISDIEVEDAERLLLLFKKYPNIVLKISYADVDIYDFIKEHYIPFYFEDLVSGWDEFYGIVTMPAPRPKYIYLSGEICFHIATAAFIAHNNDVEVRIIPNYAQSQWEDLPDIIKFFIRPEDMHIYAPYVDVVELFIEQPHQLNILYEIYRQKEEWPDDLRYIIFNLKRPLPNNDIISIFGESRIRCQKRCLKGNSCAICLLSIRANKIIADKINKIIPF